MSRPIYCQRCERPDVLCHAQEPYRNGWWWVALQCVACGWSKILRDDFAPQNVGKERHPH